MIENRAYLQVDKKYSKEVIELLRSYMADSCEIIPEGEVYGIVCYDNDAFELQLRNFAKMEMEDLQVPIHILIVPFFNKHFNKYVPMSNIGVTTLFELFLKKKESDMVLADCKRILQRVDRKEWDTIGALLSCNMNSLKTAEMLYLHRNSLNYRMNKFINTTSMDIRDFNTMLFIKLLFTIVS